MAIIFVARRAYQVETGENFDPNTTPVFVPAAAGSLFGRVCAANPLSWLFDGIRAAAYGGHGSPIAAGIGLVIGLLLLFVGWMFCRIARPHVVERMLG
jgi:ABC-type polysaccharide/polyol phosphate export permease